jgi:hypothetical protein
VSPVNVAVTVVGPSVAPETFAIEQLTAPVELTTPLHDCVPSRKVTVCPAGLGGAVLPSPSRSAGPPSSSRAESDVDPLPARAGEDRQGRGVVATCRTRRRDMTASASPTQTKIVRIVSYLHRHERSGSDARARSDCPRLPRRDAARTLYSELLGWPMEAGRSRGRATQVLTRESCCKS